MSEHINAQNKDIAKTVIMPGDPIRAKFIAEHFLDNYKLVNTIRGMYAYTGTYKGKTLTIMAHGIGIPSMGIYSYELFKDYDVDNIIRIGTAGAYIKELKPYDLLLVKNCYSESTYAKTQNNTSNNTLNSSNKLNKIILETAENLNMKINYAKVHSSDVFYKEIDNYKELVSTYGCIACEMESFSLFHNANVLQKNASCILTISNNLETLETTTSEEREKTLIDMITLSLESAIKL